LEFKKWQHENQVEWTLVSPSKKRVQVAMNAMKCYIPKPIVRTDKSVQKTLKFVDSLEYSACKGYNKPSSPRPSDCSPLILDIVGPEHGAAAGNLLSNAAPGDGPSLDNNSSDPSGLDGLNQVV
jgi:hypothetical protein